MLFDPQQNAPVLYYHYVNLDVGYRYDQFFFGWSKLDSTVMQIAAWIPPVSITTAPMQYAVGNFSALQLAASLLNKIVMSEKVRINPAEV